MPKTKKVDGVIEAVHYKNGQIVIVRAYERRGATYSDIVHLDRKSLIERLEKGRQFFTGRRENLMASTFMLDKQVKMVNSNGRQFVTTREAPDRDEIEAPVF